jgi:hypothetical protein
MSINATRLHTMQLTYTINDHRGLRPTQAAEAAINAKSRAEALPPWEIPTMTYAERTRDENVGSGNMG